MRVKVTELEVGCILKEDIYGNTNHPIIEKKTVLTQNLIDILKLFLIPFVDVDKTIVDGSMFIPKEGIEEEIVYEEKSITTMFLEAVREYKKEFQLWQSGVPVDINKIRNILLPLLDKMEENPSEIFYLHRLSSHEDYLYQHAVAFGLLSSFIAGKEKYSKGEVVQIALAGFLADCGMAKVSPRILHKKTTLTPKEFEEIKNHATNSYKMIRNIASLNESTKVAIIQHHERIDGSGYIFGLNGNEIHPIAKILAVADTFHAMTSERLYRSKQSPFKVLELMQQDYFGKFDLLAVKALEEGIMRISKGSKIRLSDGQVGEVIFVNGKYPTRPLIKMIKTEQIINLQENNKLYIEEIID